LGLSADPPRSHPGGIPLTHATSSAHRVAWAAVKHSYQKVGDRWIARESA
jgi:hypothetical protein